MPTDLIIAFTTGFTIISRLKTLADKTRDVQFQTYLVDLEGALSSAKLQVANLESEMATLKTENESLKGVLKRRDETKPSLKWSCYQFPGEDGLFCPVCYQKEGVKMPVSRVNSKHRRCPSCGALLSC